MSLNSTDKKILLKLARQSIVEYLQNRTRIKPLDLPVELLKKRACFVTLHLNSRLRGCIGSLEAHRPLVEDVVENALAAAFADPRFPSLTESELAQCNISISILTAPKPLHVKNAVDLLEKLVPNKHGLTIKKGLNRATFLPVVWKELQNKEEFLSHLCLKAGLSPDAWKNANEMKFEVYEAQEFSE